MEMKKMKSSLRISPMQLFCSMILVELGSAILLGIAYNAKKDAWIALLISTVICILLYFMYLALFNYYPNLPLTSYVQKIWGPYLGWIVAFLYVIYFIYLASRILRDFTELVIIGSYQHTTILTVGICFILAISYALSKNINAFGRISTICLLTIASILAFIILGEVFSNVMRADRLVPLLENGWKPVWKTVFPSLITAPFGEIIIFAMILPFLDKKEKARKYGILAIITSGGYLALSSIINLSVLGESIAAHSSFPILSSVTIINIDDFITRMTAFVVFAMVILGFFKIGLICYCAILGTSHLFKVKDQRLLILPIGLLIIYSSIILALNFNEHIHEGFSVVPIYIQIPFQYIIPALLLITTIIKTRYKKRITPKS